jgi:hypothetical protein
MMINKHHSARFYVYKKKEIYCRGGVIEAKLRVVCNAFGNSGGLADNVGRPTTTLREKCICG